MSADKRIGIGFVGAGGNTRLRHLPGFRELPGIDFAVVANRTEDSSRRVAAEFGIRRIARDWREVVAAPDVDAVCIGTWPCLHAEVTIAALQLGKHVLTEARMARSVAEAEQMLSAARAHPDRVAQIVPAPMSLDLDAAIIAHLDGGSVGEVREVCVTHTGGQYADAGAPLSWRQDDVLSGCNTLTVGIYYEMVRRWMRRDPECVLAHGAVFTGRRRRADGSEEEVRIPESVTILGKYAGGGRFVGHFSGVEPGASRNEIRINGSHGSLRVDLGAARLFASGLDGREGEVHVPPEGRRGWRVEADFVASIRGLTPVSLTSFEDGLRYMRFTEAMFRAQELGGAWVPLVE